MLDKSWRALNLRGLWMGCLSAALLLVACDDEGTTGNQDICVGVGCVDVRNADTRGGTDTNTTNPTDTQQADTFVAVCSAGETACANATTLLVCQNGKFEEQLCLGTEVCVNGNCQSQTCTPGLPFGCETSGQETDQIRICEDDGVNFRVESCPEGQKCYQGTCGDLVCNPGEQRCKNAEEREQCNAAGTGWEFLEVCGLDGDGKDTLCQEGQCRDLCSLNSKVASFLGCEYYVVDLDNSSAAELGEIPTDDRPFGITVSNPDPARSARVRVAGGSCSNDGQCPGTGTCGGGGVCSVIDEVPPLGLKLIELNPLSDVDDTGVHQNATFKVDSSIPVTVHQFNPLNGVGVFSNDASLLLPINALGTEYVSLANAPDEATDNFGKIFRGFPESCSNNGQCSLGRCGPEGYCMQSCTSEAECDSLCNGCEVLTCDASSNRCTLPPNKRTYTDVVATVDGTTITVTSPIDIPAANITAGTPANFTLNAGDLLHLLSEDASSLRINADNPVAAFSGSICANVPNDVPFCDHLEQQLFPVDTWGTQFVAAKSFPRGTEDDFWRIIANEDNTVITLSPGQTDLATDTVITTKTLAAGEVLELKSTSDFEVSADKRIMVGQFWVGSNYPGIPPSNSCSTNAIYNTSCTSSLECFFAGAGDTCVGGSCVASCNTAADCPTGGSTPLVCRNDGTCWSETGIGDPAYSLAVPTEQYRSDYIVLTPVGYEENYMTLVVPTGKQIIMDGNRVTDTPDGLNGTWDIYRLSVNEGAHTLLLPSGTFGVTAYGYNCDVSYAYPGGLNLLQLN